MAETTNIALVISGGGAKGAFAVGVIKHLYTNYRSTGWFSICGGTSTGAMIAPFVALMAGREPMRSRALQSLLNCYTNVTTSDILEHQNIFELIQRQDCLNESDPLNDLIHRHLSTEWFEWLAGPEAPECYVVYTNYQTGQNVTASPRDDGMTRDGFIQAMLASASVPVVMEATRIDGDVCYDGGVRELLPFAKAIDLGAETILPIFLDPEEFGKTSGRFRRMDKILLRTLAILVDEAGRNDFSMANLVNIGVQSKKALLSAFEKDAATLEKIERIFDREEFRPLFGPEKRLVRIVKGLRPDKSLTENSLTFDPVKMRWWVELGEQKADEIIQGSPFS